VVNSVPAAAALEHTDLEVLERWFKKYVAELR
jgi:hypothetical protein